MGHFLSGEGNFFAMLTSSRAYTTVDNLLKNIPDGIAILNFESEVRTNKQISQHIGCTQEEDLLQSLSRLKVQNGTEFDNNLVDDVRSQLQSYKEGSVGSHTNTEYHQDIFNKETGTVKRHYYMVTKGKIFWEGRISVLLTLRNTTKIRNVQE